MTNDARSPGGKRIYYHGGKAGLFVGGYILPAAETGYTKLDRRLKDVFGEYDEDVYDMNLVYTTTQPEWAIPYAAVCNGWVYEIQPEGEMSPEQDDFVSPRDLDGLARGLFHGCRFHPIARSMCWTCSGPNHNARLLFLVAGRRGRRGTVRTTVRIEPAQARNVDEEGAQGNAEGRSVTLQEVEARLCTLRVADARSYPA
jgi:hypothetical protein